MPNRHYFTRVAFSAHPIPTTATGEVAGDLIDSGHTRPDILFIFVTTPFAGILEDVAATLRKLTSPTQLVGCAAERIFSPDGWLVEEAAIGALAINIGEVECEYIPSTGEQIATLDDHKTRIVLADPFTTQLPRDKYFSGGYATSGKRPGTNKIVINDQIVSEGCVVISFDHSQRVRTSDGAHSMTLAEWSKTTALLAFSEDATDFWIDAVRINQETQSDADEAPPVISGFVSNLRFLAPLAAFGVDR